MKNNILYIIVTQSSVCSEFSIDVVFSAETVLTSVMLCKVYTSEQESVLNIALLFSL